MRRAVVCSGIVLSAMTTAYASPDLSATLRKMTQSLTQQYPQPAGAKPSLAVFPLDSNERLMKKRVGFALSELLTHEFVQTGAFTVVERSELLRVFEEQKLQQSGAIDPASAVRVGKLLGANLAVLGSVEEAGGKYLVNARLVRMEDGTVVATAFQEVERDEFEETARPYLAVVPRSQSVSFYVGYRYQTGRTGSVSQLAALSRGFPVTRDVQGKSMSFPWGVFGIRYNPTAPLVLDFSGMVALNNPTYATVRDVNGGWFETYNNGFSRIYSMRGLVGWKRNLGNRIQTQLSGGVAHYVMRWMADNGFNAGHATSTTPTVQAALEFRPQPRIGISLGASYDLRETKANMDSTSLKMQQWAVEPSLSVNF